MMKHIILIALLAIGCNGASISQTFPGSLGRIIGGESTDITKAPFMVSLLYDQAGTGKYRLICSGTILSDSVILTAGHCLSGTRAARWKVRAGSPFVELEEDDAQVLGVKDFTINAAFNQFLDYDIALMYLSQPIQIDGVKTKPIKLPARNIEVEDNEELEVAGWGSIKEGGDSSNYLQKVSLKVFNQLDCRRLYFEYNPVTDRMICAGNMAGGQGVCHGDSGGPMFKDDTIIGITSWGRGCAVAGQPSVYTRVSEMLSWIEANMP